MPLYIDPKFISSAMATDAEVDAISTADRQRSNHTGNESSLTWNEVSTPSAPASGLTTYAKDVGGRQMYSQIGKSGIDFSFQPFIARNRVTLWQANGNATTFTVFGAPNPSASGTATTRNVATTNFYTWCRRLGYVSGTGNNSVAGIRATAAQFGRSNATGRGGFHFITRFAVSDAVLAVSARLFVGLTATTTVLGNNDPVNFANLIGVGMDAGDTNLHIFHNDSVGSATKIDLGPSFPESTNTDVYELTLFNAPNMANVYYKVINLTTNAEASGILTTNLPAVNTLLAWQLWRHNSNTGLAVGLDIISVYLETDN